LETPNPRPEHLGGAEANVDGFVKQDTARLLEGSRQIGSGTGQVFVGWRLNQALTLAPPVNAGHLNGQGLSPSSRGNGTRLGDEKIALEAERRARKTKTYWPSRGCPNFPRRPAGLQGPRKIRPKRRIVGHGEGSVLGGSGRAGEHDLRKMRGSVTRKRFCP